MNFSLVISLVAFSVLMTISMSRAQLLNYFNNIGSDAVHYLATGNRAPQSSNNNNGNSGNYFGSLTAPFLTSQNNNNNNNYQLAKPQQSSQRIPQGPSNSNCGSYFSYRTGLFGYGTSSGLIEIPHPDPVRSEVRAILTVATQLSVKTFFKSSDTNLDF